MKLASKLVLSLIVAATFAACGDDGEGSGAAAPDPIAQLPVAQSIRIPGLGGQVQVVYDEIGIPHVYAPDAESATYAQGYLTAQVRFWEMDVIRRFAEGRLSEILGKVTLQTDIGMRTFFTTRDGRRIQDALWEHVQQVDPEMARIGQAYANGVNAWLADLRNHANGAKLPPEYTLDILLGQRENDLQEWRPQDSLAVGRLQAFSLSDSSGDDMFAGRAVHALPETVYKDVFRSVGVTNATAIPHAAALQPRAEHAAVAAAPLPDDGVVDAVMGGLRELHAQTPWGGKDQDVGSNNWIVSPALSANGHAMLANDPHLALFNPPIWHMIHLTYGEGANQHTTNGVIFPGLPGVILGHNDVAAWGATTSGYDVTDVYVEQYETPPDYPASPRTVLFKGQHVPVLRINETFKIKGQPDFVHVLEVVPHHGPAAADPSPRDTKVGLEASGGMTIRWTGHEITNDSRFLFDLGRSRNVSDFKDSLRNFGVGGQNWIWADITGNIAYSSRVLIPQRPAGVIPWMPLPGTGEAEWLTDAQGKTLWLPVDKIPQAVNPLAGFLVTSNNDTNGNTLDNDPLNDEQYLSNSYDLGFRAQRITEMLTNADGNRAAGAKITAADMSHYQYDHSAKEAIRLLPYLFQAYDGQSPEGPVSEALERLHAWAIAKPGSPACNAVSGIDAHELRDDIAPRPTAVSDEERQDAIATAIFGSWVKRVYTAIFADDFAGTGISAPGGDDAVRAVLHIIEDLDRTDAGFIVHTKGASGQSTLWDNKSTPGVVETRDQILRSSFQDALTFAETKFATDDQTQWLWGKIHQVQFQHFVGQAGVPIFDLGPFAGSGSRFTVNPANFGATGDSFTYSGGPSMRFVAELDPAGIRAVNILPGGNNGDPGGTASENYNRINPAIHYGDHVAGWVNGTTFQYHLTRDDVASHSLKKVVLVP